MSHTAGERCYDCGKLIPEGKVRRREVAVSRIDGGATVFASGNAASASGGATTYAKVSLCPRCNRLRDEEDAAAERSASACLVTFLVAGVVLAVVLGILAYVLRS